MAWLIRSRAAVVPATSGAKPPSSPRPVLSPCFFRTDFERVVHLGTPAQRLDEAGRADGRHHELLDVNAGVGVRTAVEDVHHRHRQDVRVRPTDVAEQRQLGRIGGRFGDGQRDAQDRVATQPGLVGGAVEVYQRLVDQPLVVGVESDHCGPDLIKDGLHGLLHALAAVALAPVA